MQAMLRPNGIAHLEDPTLQDKLELARGIAWGITPGSTVGGLAQLWFSRLSSLGSLVLVARFRLWLAVVLLIANMITLRSKRKAFINMTQLYAQGTERCASRATSARSRWAASQPRRRAYSGSARGRSVASTRRGSTTMRDGVGGASPRWLRGHRWAPAQGRGHASAHSSTSLDEAFGDGSAHLRTT